MKFIPAAIHKLNAWAFPANAIEPRIPGNSKAVIMDPAFPKNKDAECARLIDKRAVTIPTPNATSIGHRNGPFLFARKTQSSAGL
ncbi:MAG: hypothetical protein ABSE87_00850 [Terracidiphilus sp.]|jgi:hypothetical protein